MPPVLALGRKFDCLRYGVHSPQSVDTVGQSCPLPRMIASST
jgi:hypothetical protein